jgi:predicted Ser/Thr protein kinase/tetratricopeptide (TPR) repeat protein
MAEADAELEPDPLLDDGLRAARPDVDVVAAVAQARVLSALFGAEAAAPVRIGRYEVERRLGEGGGGVVYVAMDPELSRRVAIKLIRSEGQQGRVLAEGHALAKLSHPNIVPLHDVGTVDDRVFLVMELVEGETLRAYVAGAPRTVAEVVRVYRQAGEGLAAAHRAGIVHRDFKPDNAVVGADGRVRVLDFGLARAGAVSPDSVITRDERGGASSSGGGAVHTRAGIGTPRYMAPEQIAGDPLTAATDQYAFCVSLREALGARKAKVPRWIEPILTRGTSRVPEARYPSMTALLAALARDPATVWRRRGVALGAVAAVGAAAAAFAAGRAGDTGPACDGGPAELAAVWTPAARSRVAGHLAGLGTPYAASAAPTLLATFDGYGTSWLAGHRAACEAHRSGAQSPQLLDQRMACLARARAAFGASIDVATSTAADGVAKAVEASGSLPALARCADAALLVESGAPPPTAQVAAVAQLDGELAALEVAINAGVPGSGDEAVVLRARAEAIGYGPTVADALRLVALSMVNEDHPEEMIGLYRRAGTVALSAGDVPIAIDAFARDLYFRGTRKDPVEALADAEVYRALATQMPPGAHAERALLENNLGAVHLAAGQRDLARQAFERSHAEVAAIDGPVSLELVSLHGNLALAIDDVARRHQLYVETTEALSRAVGADHPLTLESQVYAAIAEPDVAAAIAALEKPCLAVASLHPALGETVVGCAAELGWLAYSRGDVVLARRAFELVVGARGAAAIRVDIAHGYLALVAGEPAAAARSFERAITANESDAWYAVAMTADAILGRALASRATGAPGSRALLEQARDGYVRGFEGNGHVRFQRRIAYVDALLARP